MSNQVEVAPHEQPSIDHNREQNVMPDELVGVAVHGDLRNLAHQHLNAHKENTAAEEAEKARLAAEEEDARLAREEDARRQAAEARQALEAKKLDEVFVDTKSEESVADWDRYLAHREKADNRGYDLDTLRSRLNNATNAGEAADVMAQLNTLPVVTVRTPQGNKQVRRDTSLQDLRYRSSILAKRHEKEKTLAGITPDEVLGQKFDAYFQYDGMAPKGGRSERELKGDKTTLMDLFDPERGVDVLRDSITRNPQSVGELKELLEIATSNRDLGSVRTLKELITEQQAKDKLAAEAKRREPFQRTRRRAQATISGNMQTLTQPSAPKQRRSGIKSHLLDGVSGEALRVFSVPATRDGKPSGEQLAGPRTPKAPDTELTPATVPEPAPSLEAPITELAPAAPHETWEEFAANLTAEERAQLVAATELLNETFKNGGTFDPQDVYATLTSTAEVNGLSKETFAKWLDFQVELGAVFVNGDGVYEAVPAPEISSSENEPAENEPAGALEEDDVVPAEVFDAGHDDHQDDDLWAALGGDHDPVPPVVLPPVPPRPRRLRSDRIDLDAVDYEAQDMARRNRHVPIKQQIKNIVSNHVNRGINKRFDDAIEKAHDKYVAPIAKPLKTGVGRLRYGRKYESVRAARAVSEAKPTTERKQQVARKSGRLLLNPLEAGRQNGRRRRLAREAEDNA